MNKTAKQILTIISILIFLAFLLFVFYIKIWPKREEAQSSKEPAKEQTEKEQPANAKGFGVTKEENEIKNSAQNPEKENTVINEEIATKTKDDWYYYNLANKTLDADNCVNINNNLSKNICYQQIAIANADTALCQKIKDEKKQEKCKNFVQLEKTKKTEDLSNCNSLSDTMLEIACFKDIIIKNENADCTKIEDEKMREYCDSEQKNYLAKKNNDPEYCKKINTAITRANCFSILLNKDLFSDEDKDGLNFKEEIFSGTDPKEFDSDADGFSDGAEINNGYNPNGPGIIKNTSVSEKMSCLDIQEKSLSSLCLIYNADGIIDFSNCNLFLDSIELYEFCLKR